jgi:hypothetical protein
MTAHYLNIKLFGSDWTQSRHIEGGLCCGEYYVPFNDLRPVFFGEKGLELTHSVGIYHKHSTFVMLRGCATLKIIHGAMFQRDLLQDDPGQVIEWWEEGRVLQHRCGMHRIMTCILMLSCALISEPLVGEPSGLSDPPIFGLIGIFCTA